MAWTLENIVPGVFAWLADDPGHGFANAGVVVAEDGLTIVDSCTTPDQARPLVGRLGELTELPIRRLVYTSSHLDHVGGSTAFALAAVYGTAQTSHLMDQPVNPDVWQQLHPEHPGAFAELTTRPVTHTIAEPAHLCPASIAVPTIGHQFENLVVQVPAANVVFAGSMASFGCTPLGFDADFPAWIDSLETMKSWGDVFVPGHGRIGGQSELTTLQDYVQACIDAKGVVANLPDGPWTDWTDRHFDEINVERAAMLAAGDASPPPSLLLLLGLG